MILKVVKKCHTENLINAAYELELHLLYSGLPSHVVGVIDESDDVGLKQSMEIAFDGGNCRFVSHVLIRIRITEDDTYSSRMTPVAGDPSINKYG